MSPIAPISTLLAALILSADAPGQSTALVRFDGTVVTAVGPLAAPFDAVVAGDTVVIQYEVRTPGTPSALERSYEVVRDSVAVTIGGATAAGAQGPGGSITFRVEPGLASLTGRVPLEGGFELDHLLHDLEPLVAFPGTDITQMFGSRPATDVDLPFLAVVSGSTGIQVDLQLITFGPGDGPGVRYCGPAEPSSINAPADLTGAGTPSLTANDLILEVSSLPPNVFGMFVVSREQDFLPNAGGSQGNLCLGGPIGRFNGPGQIRSSGAAGEIRLPVDWTALPQPNGFDEAVAGETWSFQLWYRDVVGGVPVSNLSNGYAVTAE